MSKFVKLTFNDDMYYSVSELANFLDIPVASLCNLLISLALSKKNCIAVDFSEFRQFIKEHSFDGEINSELLLCYLGNHTVFPKFVKNLKKLKKNL